MSGEGLRHQGDNDHKGVLGQEGILYVQHHVQLHVRDTS